MEHDGVVFRGLFVYRSLVAEGFGDELTSGGGVELFVQVFDMIMDGVRRAIKILGDLAHGMPQYQLVQNFMLTIGEPGLWVGDILERLMSSLGDQVIKLGECINHRDGWR